MAHEQQINTLIADNRRSLLRVALRITIYYVVLAVVLVVLTATVPRFVDQLPLGGVGEISDFGSSSIYDLEEALLSADDEEIEDIVTESTRARLARGPASPSYSRCSVPMAQGSSCPGQAGNTTGSSSAPARRW